MCTFPAPPSAAYCYFTISVEGEGRLQLPAFSCLYGVNVDDVAVVDDGNLCDDDKAVEAVVVGSSFRFRRVTFPTFLGQDKRGLLAKNCNPMPDTCLKRKRHLVAKPFPPTAMTHGRHGSVTIAVCRAMPQSATPVITSSTSTGSTHWPDKQFESQSCPVSQPEREAPSCTKSRKSSSSSSENSKDKEGETSASMGTSHELQTGSSSVGNGNQAADSSSSTCSKGNVKDCKQKKRKKREAKAAEAKRRRHNTEPCSPEQGTSRTNRRRGTSLSITYGDASKQDHYPWYFEVEVNNEDDDDDKSEVLSVQGRETVSVHDSTDDLWFLEEDSIQVEVDSDTEFSVEYDVESDNSPVSESDISSVRSGQGLLVVCRESDVEFFADYSDTDSNPGDKELTDADNWTCNVCQQKNEPLLRYCSRCWKLRSDWLPSQLPVGKISTDSEGKNIEKDPEKVSGLTKSSEKVSECPKSILPVTDCLDSGVGSLSSTQETISSQISMCKDDSVFDNSVPKTLKKLEPPSVKDFDISHKSLLMETQETETRYSFSNFQTKNSSSSSLDSSVSPKKSSQDRKVDQTSMWSNINEPCIICLTKPKTASLIHGSSGHQVCCFSCAKRLKRRGKVCPVCRRPIQKVVKNYVL